MDKYKPPVEGVVDKALGVGRDLIAPAVDLFIPGSSAGINLFTEILKTPYERRLQRWQEEIGTAVIQLSEGRKNIVNELKANDEFQTILIQATQAVIRSHQEEKLTALRNAVINTAEGIDINADLKQLFVRYLDELTPSHLSLLRFFSENEWHLKQSKSYGTLLNAFVAGTRLRFVAPDEFKLLCEELKSRVLLRVSASVEDFDDVYDAVVITTEGSAGDRPLLRVTSIGKQFLKFISSPLDSPQEPPNA